MFAARVSDIIVRFNLHFNLPLSSGIISTDLFSDELSTDATATSATATGLIPLLSAGVGKTLAIPFVAAIDCSSCCLTSSVFHGFLAGAKAGLGTEEGTFSDLGDILSEDDELVLFPSVDAVVLLLEKLFFDCGTLGSDNESCSARIGICIGVVT